MSKKVCIYHGGCTDGVAAAWAVWLKHSDCTFYPGVYQVEPPWDLIEGATEDLIFVDFSYKQPVMREIIKRCPVKPLILDHHKTAETDLKPLLAAGELYGKFDMDRCGALLAWDWFHPQDPRPELFQIIDAQDRWLNSRDPKLIMALRSYPHAPEDESAVSWAQMMEQWLHLMENPEDLRNESKGIYRYYRQRVNETKLNVFMLTLAGREVSIVNAPHSLASDVAGELCKETPSGVAAVWWQNKDRSVTFSLRSRGEPDVSSIALEYGGGGHKNAAGFKIEWPDFVNMMNSKRQP